MNQVSILLVEDNPDDAELTLRALRKRDLLKELVHLEDGAEALDFLFGRNRFKERDLTQNPKLILLDLKLPKITGLEVLEQIKREERLRNIPVVVLSSSREDPDIRKAYHLGVNSYIVKPVDFDQFLTAVSDVGVYWVLLNQPPE